MADKLLLDIEEVTSRLGLSADLDFSDSLEKAIRASQMLVESELQTSLQRVVNREDVFYLDKDAYSGIQPAGVFRMLLGHGFVTGTPTLTYGPTWRDATAFPVDPLLTKFNAEKGLMYIDSEEYGDQYVKITYTSGFDSMGQLPDWLKEALLSRIPDVLKLNQANTEGDSQPNKVANVLKLTTLENKNRNIGFCIRPMFV